MAWIDRLIDRIPDSPASVGAWMIVGGSIGMLAASLLRDLPLSLGSLLLYSAGYFGPAFHDLKQRRKARRSAVPMLDDPHEDARVSAFVLAREREAAAVRVQESGACEDQPPRHRLH